jgi:hypothetical protein
MANGIASKDTTIGPIDVSQLIGRADPDIVSPRATAALGDAFRTGFITADDVLNRVGEMGQAKEKAQIDVANAQSMAAQEQTSPEARAARAAQLGNVVPGAELQGQQIERQKILLQYPAIAYFEKFAPEAGIQAPTLPDGSPDYKEMERIGAEMAVWQSQKSDALKELSNIERTTSNNGEVLFAVTKQGQPVDQNKVRSLESRATASFRRQAPGSIEVAPRDAPMPKSVIDVEVAPVSGVPPVGSPVPGGISLGPPKQAPTNPEDAAKRQAQVVAAEGITPVIENALAAVARGGGIGPAEGSLIGQVGNRVAAALGLGREQQFQDQRQLEMAISNKVLEGAQVMKGNLSDKDVRFLQATVPKLSDTLQVWNEYLNRWKQMNDLNIEILAGRQPKVTKDIFSVSAPAATASATAAPANAPVQVNSPSEAPSTAQFIQAPDGRVFRNPNYRP